jgi:hypothetical protein
MAKHSWVDVRWVTSREGVEVRAAYADSVDAHERFVDRMGGGLYFAFDETSGGREYQLLHLQTPIGSTFNVDSDYGISIWTASILVFIEQVAD